VKEDLEEQLPELIVERGSVRFEVMGMEVLTKKVKQSGNSGRIYLPPNWVGRRVKIVRLD
jgi:putative transposon-encoded protein